MDLVFSRITKIPKRSFGQECSLCSSRHGVPIGCSAKGCKAAYHTTCAIRGKLKMQAIFGKNFKGGIKLRSYCKEHSPSINPHQITTNSQVDKINANGIQEIDMTNLADDKFQDESELDYFWKYSDLNEVHKSISKAYKRSNKLARLDEMSENGSSHSMPKKLKKSNQTDSPPPKRKSSDDASAKLKDVDPLMLDLIYRYWILLRTSNNGQSLIKFSPTALKERENEQRKSIMKLRIELERIRNLSYMIGKREKLKSTWLKTHHNIIKHTFGIISDIEPAQDNSPPLSLTNGNNQKVRENKQYAINISLHTKKMLNSLPNLQTTNGMFDESDQLINDLVTCDQIYEVESPTNNNANLSYQERSTLERRRTLSLVRRINRQLKGVISEPSMNPYAKNYLAPKRSDSPVASQNNNRFRGNNKC